MNFPNEILMTFRADKKTQGTVFFSDPIEGGDGDKGLTIHDVLADPCRPEEKVEEREEIKHLYQAVENSLTERQKKVIQLRYGLGGQRSHTQQQVAEKLGVSRSYVSRIEKKSLENLQKTLKCSKKQSLY